jgi:photosystem II stability/assembly factor-like uncharacterized protein
MKKLFCILMFLIPIVVFPQWQLNYPLPTGNTLSSVWFTNANTGYAVGDAGTIIKTNNGGSNWTIGTSGTNYHLTSVFFTGADTGYAVGLGGTILKTIDAGTTWDSLSSGIVYYLLSVHFADASTGFAVGQSGTILKTSNGGALWTNQSQPITYDYNSVYFINADTGYIGGGDMPDPEDETIGGILNTNNGGTLWTETSRENEALTSVYFTNANTGYAVGYWEYYGHNGYPNPHGTVIIKTTNGGANWTEQTSGISNALYSVYFINADTGYAVGDSGTIIKTTNGGELWTKQTSGTSKYLTSVFFVNSDTGYAVGAGGIILKTTNGGGMGIDEFPVSLKLLKIYPNPATDKITVETFATQGQSQLSIMNLNGQEVLTSQLTKKNIIIDISGLSCGVYVVKLIGSKGMQMGKFVKE